MNFSLLTINLFFRQGSDNFFFMKYRVSILSYTIFIVNKKNILLLYLLYIIYLCAKCMPFLNNNQVRKIILNNVNFIVYRINLLGWTSRQQFEETWMCLLSVLCAPTDNLEPLELNDVLYASSLAMKSITTLLLETLTDPVVGDPNISKLMHISRNSPIEDSSVG